MAGADRVVIDASLLTPILSQAAKRVAQDILRAPELLLTGFGQ